MIGAKPPASLAEARENALFILEETVKGLGGDTFGELIGLPLLPLADGSLGRFLPPPVPPEAEADAAGSTVSVLSSGGGGAKRAQRAVFVCSDVERRLLAGEGRGGTGGGAGRRLLEDLDNLSGKVKGLLADVKVHAATNVAVMEPADLVGMLGEVFPEAWEGLKQVAWAPGSRDVS